MRDYDKEFKEEAIKLSHEVGPKAAQKNWESQELRIPRIIY